MANKQTATNRKMVGQYLRRLTDQYLKEVLAQKMESIVDFVTIPKNFDEETELHNYMKIKHL
jgi:hypothetical protein